MKDEKTVHEEQETLALTFGSKISTLLKQKGMTQADLVKASGLTKSSISKYISGKMVPTAPVIKAIAEALTTTSDYLLGIGEDDELLPCPFCGSRNVDYTDLGASGEFEDWAVECHDCGIAMLPAGEEPGCIRTKKEAAMSWNRRPGIKEEEL